MQAKPPPLAVRQHPGAFWDLRFWIYEGRRRGGLIIDHAGGFEDGPAALRSGGFCEVFSIDNALSLWLNNAAGWKHLAPGGVPGSHN